MIKGLLWFDDSGKELSAKVTEAARRYRRKHGTDATHCYVHPSTLKGGKVVEVGGVEIAPLSTVLRHHFWLGVEDKNNVRNQN